jgi:hypothetical protein
MPIEQAFVGLLKLLFKLTIIWPTKLLFFFGRWGVEAAQDAKAAEQSRRSQAQNATWEQKREAERRSRNTLYGGVQHAPPEPLQKSVETTAPVKKPDIESLVRDALSKLSPEQRMLLRRKLNA